MALDTVSKRYSAINMFCPWRGIYPLPDGTLGPGDRQHLMFMCTAVLALAPAPGLVVALLGQRDDPIGLLGTKSDPTALSGISG